MKPEDLKSPFTFKQRRPVFDDHILYVPLFYSHHDQYNFSFHHYFPKQQPIFIEYCSGNGDWIVEKAQEMPHRNWIAVEKRFDRARKIWSKLKNHLLSNLLIVCGEGYTFTHHYLPSQSVAGIFINFPDPWPKTKHAKHRLIQPSFLDEATRILQEGGETVFVTDDLMYLKQTLACFCTHDRFVPLYPEPFYITDVPEYGASWFEQLWRSHGKEIYHAHFCKKHHEIRT